MASIGIIRGGLLTSIQDLGRWGRQGDGVPVAGPMDPYSHRLANRLVGNVDEAAALEITLVGPEIEMHGDVVCAVAGAQFDLEVGGRPAPYGRPFEVRSGARLRFRRRVAGARATLALRGGLDVPALFGSRSTSLSSGMGPFGGRPLAPGDVVPVGRGPLRLDVPSAPYELPLPRGGARLRAIPGPQDTWFSEAALDAFFSARFVVSPASNRMGYRLDGPALHAARPGELLSEATPLGSVQVPRAGTPILLMADRQTTGGYPKIATVISADAPLAGQLAPGDWVRFTPCTRAEALDALRRLERRLAGIGR